MRLYVNLWVLVLATPLIGCATTQLPSQAAAANGQTLQTAPAQPAATVVATETVPVADQSEASAKKYHCRSIKPTGSHRKITRCVSTKQKRAEEDAARTKLLKTNRNSMGGAGTP